MVVDKFAFLKEAFAQQQNGRLSEEDELHLLKQFQAGDTKAGNKLKLSLRPLVEKTIVDVSPSGSDVSSSNLRMRAHIELPKILQNFDQNRDIKLKTYVTNMLKGYLRNAVAENVSGPYVPRNQHTDLERYRQAVRDAQMEFGQNPTEEQIRKFYPEDASTEFHKIKQYHLNSYLGDATFGNDEENDGLTFKDQFTANDDTINDDDLFSSLYDEQENDIISKNFTPQEQQVIKKVTKEGQSFVSTALSLGITTAQVRKIMRRWHEVTQKNK
jgi:DNA-directed RNA polymerase specialized sigma subunit